MTTQELRKMEITFTEEELQNEIWLPIKDFEDYYEVSDLGRFRSKFREIVRHNGIIERKPARVLKNNYYSNGYVQLILYVDKIRYNFLAHRLIADHFLPNLENYRVVNHLNMVKWDNRVINLERCTHKENTLHAVKNGAFDGGKRYSRVNEDQVRHIRENYKHEKENTPFYNEYYKDVISRETFNSIGKYKSWKNVV